MPKAERYQQYELLRREDGSLWELGRGAMGITYKAYDTNLLCTVALKVINSAYIESNTARQRFLREARAAAALRHPNVASVFNLSTEQDNYFYIMEFIDGETVEACVKRKGPLEPAEALNITLQVARALAAAAKERLVHRDLKPANLMLVDQEGEPTVKVIDFGLAKSEKGLGEDSGALTMGGFVGTAQFASPEQVEEADLDTRSDIYSLGATLYFMVAGHPPFSGAVHQIMSQHLYRSIPIEPLAHIPRCVVSLIQNMMEKDRNQRPQTPRDLQNLIVGCLEEIRVFSVRDARGAGERQCMSPGTLLTENYRLIEEFRNTPQGRQFLAEDLRWNRRVNLLVLSREFVSDPHCFRALEVAVNRLQNAPHPMLRAIYSLEPGEGYDILVEEHVVGPSLLDLLRSRNGLSSAPEVVRLLVLLAPLADHATGNGLDYVDLTLLGIHLINRGSTGSEIQLDLLRRPLTAWEHLEPKVNAIDFSFSHASTPAGLVTQTESPTDSGPRGSCLRLLSLLAYELLGGPRARVEATGQYTPIPTLTKEGNAALRRGVANECSSAVELASQLAAAVGIKRWAAPGSENTEGVTPEPFLRTLPAEAPTAVTIKRHPTVSLWRLVLILGMIALMAIGGYVIYWLLRRPPDRIELATLSVQTEPLGASLLLDGKPPQEPPNTFTHVPFGSHRLSASLKGYLSAQQELELNEATSSKVALKLQPIPTELPALSIQTEPPGASLLLDGKPPQKPPNTFTHVSFGSHRLTANLKGYVAAQQELQVNEATSPKIALKLQPIPTELAALSIQTEPPDASLLLDGKPPQEPPNTFTHVSFGSHRLAANLKGYVAAQQDLEVNEATSPKIGLKLQPIPTELAALSIQTEPPGASLLLDGKPPQEPPNTFTRIPFGSHRLTANLQGYVPAQQELEVNEAISLKIALQLQPIPTELAALSIQTEPPGASLLLDGKPPQQPPNTFTDVSFGSHRLIANLQGYVPAQQDLEVNEATSPKIALKLQPIPTELAALLVQTEPPGASLLLDGMPPQEPPNTFTHVLFGKHRLTVNLKGYLLAEQDLELNEATSPKIVLKPDADAMNNLGWLYMKGDGVKQDYAKALEWYQKAAEAGNPQAMNNLGGLYMNGWGVAKDYGKASKWYQKAAEAGNPQAMNNLGGLYQYGLGVAKDHDKAREWYQKAAAAGDADAKRALRNGSLGGSQ